MRTFPLFRKKFFIQITCTIFLILFSLNAYALKCERTYIWVKRDPQHIIDRVVNGIPQIEVFIDLDGEDASTEWTNNYKVDVNVTCTVEKETYVRVSNFENFNSPLRIETFGTPEMQAVYYPPYDVSQIQVALRPHLGDNNGAVWGGHAMKTETLYPFTKTITKVADPGQSFSVGGYNQPMYFKIQVQTSLSNNFLSKPKVDNPPILKRRVATSFIIIDGISTPLVIYNFSIIPEALTRCPAEIFRVAVDKPTIDFGNINKTEINTPGNKITRPFTISISKDSTPQKKCNRDVSPKISFKSEEKTLLDTNKAIKLDNGLALRIKDSTNSYVNLNGESSVNGVVLQGNQDNVTVQNHFTAELTKASPGSNVVNGTFGTTISYIIEFP